MKFAGMNIDRIPNILKDGYIQPYTPIYITNLDGTSGYLWNGELRQSTPEFWAEVEAKYPTQRITGEDIKKTVETFKKLINELK